MKILVLGGGGREHALIWKLKQSPEVEDIFCIPGNAGIAADAQTFSLSLNDFEKIAQFIREKEIDFTIVGPEQPLVGGIVDFLQSQKIPVFGPSKIAAQLEGSKVFAKNFMKKYNIPTAVFKEFSDYQKALEYVNTLQESNIVIKADGLAAGKGSVVCTDLAEARQTLKTIMVDRIFADSGRQVVIEEFMQGEETSLFVITDGKDYIVLSPAQDFKRALDGDRGKNTGGMGSYAPTPVLTSDTYERAIKEIVEPVLNGLPREGITYKGVLYCGLMLTAAGPKVVEFNCRFGDPETQVVLPLLESDFLEMCTAVNRQTLAGYKLAVKKASAICVIATAGGYPDVYEKGKVIHGLDRLEAGVLVFHAGTAREGSYYLTNGGRVLGVAAVDSDLKTARDRVYRNIERIHFEGMFYRRDIAQRVIQSLK